MDQQFGNPGADSAGSRASNEFHIGGNVGAIATGQYGQATGNVNESGTGDALERIDRLLRKLETDASALEDEQAEEILDDVQRLHTEVHSRRPSVEGIRAMLSRLAAATSSVASMLTTVEQIRELITAIVH